MGYGHHHHDHAEHDHEGVHQHEHEIEHDHAEHDHHHHADSDSAARRLAGIAVPFGAAASPDLTILPVVLAASAVGLAAVLGVVVVFSAVTLGTFVAATVGATLAGYQIEGDWLEEHGNTVTALVLLVIGVAVYAGL